MQVKLRNINGDFVYSYLPPITIVSKLPKEMDMKVVVPVHSINRWFQRSHEYWLNFNSKEELAYYIRDLAVHVAIKKVPSVFLFSTDEGKHSYMCRADVYGSKMLFLLIWFNVEKKVIVPGTLLSWREIYKDYLVEAALKLSDSDNMV